MGTFRRWRRRGQQPGRGSPSLSTLGYLHDIEPGKACYLFHDSGWGEILTGFDPKEAAAVLQQRGFLVSGDGGRLKRKQRVGDQTPRFYTVRATILEWDASDLGKAGSVPPDDAPAAPVQWPIDAGPAAPEPDDFDYGADDFDPFGDCRAADNALSASPPQFDLFEARPEPSRQRVGRKPHIPAPEKMLLANELKASGATWHPSPGPWAFPQTPSEGTISRATWPAA